MIAERCGQRPAAALVGRLAVIDGGQPVDDHEDGLHRARQAYAAQDWRGAAKSFDAVAPHRLTSDDLAAYADSVWWLGRVEDALRLQTAACDALVAESRPADAAGVAFRLGVFHVSRGDELQGTGWLSRSKHLLEDVPECRVHGLLALTGVEANLAAGQPAAAVDAARQIRDLGRRLNAADLVAVGLNAEARALIRSGAVDDGLAMLDEAMVAVQDGRLDPFMTGVLDCHTIAACHEVSDVLRMTRWTELAEQWLTTVPAEVTFGAMCAVHRAQIKLSRGHGTKPSWERCTWLGASTSTGWTTPHRPGTSSPRFAGYAAGQALPRRTTRHMRVDMTRSRGGRCFGLLTVTPRVRWRRCSRPWLRQDPILCAAPRCVQRRSRSRSPQDIRWTLRPLRPSSRRRQPPSPHRDWRRWRQPRAVRCCWRRATSRTLCPCCVTLVGAGTNSGLSTMPPVPASDSPRPTGRSATRPPRMRSWRVRRRSISG